MLDHDLYRAQSHHQELRHEAAEWRLARLAQSNRPRHTLLHCRALDRLGRLLVALGWRLRARYGDLERATRPEQGAAFAE